MYLLSLDFDTIASFVDWLDDSTAQLCICFSTLHIVGSFYLNFLRLLLYSVVARFSTSILVWVELRRSQTVHQRFFELHLKVLTWWVDLWWVTSNGILDPRPNPNAKLDYFQFPSLSTLKFEPVSVCFCHLTLEWICWLQSYAVPHCAISVVPSCFLNFLPFCLAVWDVWAWPVSLCHHVRALPGRAFTQTFRFRYSLHRKARSCLWQRPGEMKRRDGMKPAGPAILQRFLGVLNGVLWQRKVWRDVNRWRLDVNRVNNVNSNLSSNQLSGFTKEW